MTEMMLSSILMLQCDWYGTFSKIMAHKNDALDVSSGLDRCIPPALLRGLGSRQQHFEDIEKNNPLLSREQLKLKLNPQQKQQQQQQQFRKAPIESQPAARPPTDISESTIAPGPDHHLDMDSIAVVGMSIKVAGADDLNEFVNMLKSGQS